MLITVKYKIILPSYFVLHRSIWIWTVNQPFCRHFRNLTKWVLVTKASVFGLQKGVGWCYILVHPPSPEGNIGHRGMTDPLGVFLDVEYNAATVL